MGVCVCVYKQKKSVSLKNKDKKPHHPNNNKSLEKKKLGCANKKVEPNDDRLKRYC